MSTTSELVRILRKDSTANRDYAAMLSWGIDRITAWTDQWTDFSITDPGVLFFNAGAFQYDYVNYVLDHAYLNNILRTTQSLQSLFFMSEFVGVELPSYKSAVATIKITNPFLFDVEISKDFPVYIRDDATNTELWFYLLDSVVVGADNYAEVKAIEGKRTTIKTTYGNFDKRNTFHIPIENIGTNSVSIFAKPKMTEDMEEEPEFMELVCVDDALLNLSDKLCFSVHYTYGQVYIKLPPGTWEFLDEDSEIHIRYGVTKGVESNMGEILVKPGEQILVDDTPVQEELEFRVLQAIGGTSPLSLEDARVHIGDNTWRVETLVTEDDWNLLTKNNFNGDIIRFVLKQEQGQEECRVFYLPAENITDSRKLELEDELYALANPLMFGGVVLHIQEMGYQKVSFQFEVCLSTNSSDTSRIEQDIRNIIGDYLDRRKQEKNKLLRRSEILGKIELIHEVDYAVCLSPTSDTSVEDTSIFVLAGVGIKFVQKGRSN